MKPDERILLDELKASLKSKFQKTCLEAYLENPCPDALISKALQLLQGVIDEGN